MSFGTDLAAEALELLNEFGRTVTYTRVSAGAYNPGTGTGSDATAPITLKALIEDLRLDRGQNEALSSSSTQRMTAIASSFAFLPAENDLVEAGPEKFLVQKFDAVYAGEDPVVYTFELRRG